MIYLFPFCSEWLLLEILQGTGNFFKLCCLYLSSPYFCHSVKAFIYSYKYPSLPLLTSHYKLRVVSEVYLSILGWSVGLVFSFIHFLLGVEQQLNSGISKRDEGIWVSTHTRQKWTERKSMLGPIIGMGLNLSLLKFQLVVRNRKNTQWRNQHV